MITLMKIRNAIKNL